MTIIVMTLPNRDMASITDITTSSDKNDADRSVEVGDDDEAGGSEESRG